MVGTHTPGPWFLEVTDSGLWIGVEKAAGGKVGDIITSLEYGDGYTAKHNRLALANARLITAAPDLLAKQSDALWAIGYLARLLPPETQIPLLDGLRIQAIKEALSI